MKKLTLTGWLREPRSDTALHFLEDDGSWRYATYEDLAGRVAAMAEVFRDQGLAGQRLGLVGKTSEDFVVQLFATLATGGTCVPIPDFLAGQNRGDHDRMVAFMLETTRPAKVVTTEGSESAAHWPAMKVPAYADLAPRGHLQITDSDAPALIQFTSGSTGRSKGVRISRADLEAGYTTFTDWMGFSPSDRSASWMPSWMAGNTLMAAATQWDSMQMTPLQFMQRPDRWLRCLGELGCTITSSPSFGYHHAARTVAVDTLSGCRFDEWRIAFIFAEPVRAADLDEFVGAFGPLGFRRRAFCPAYGLTEARTMIAGTLADEEPVALVDEDESVPRQAHSADILSAAVHTASSGDHMIGVGRPLPGVQMAIRLPDGSEAPDGVLGEVWVGGEILADGYEGGEDFGEWLATGDVGCLRDGVLFIFGRLVDSFNIRGRLVLAPSAEQEVRDALPEAAALIVLPNRASGAGITVVVEAGQPWPPDLTDQARRTVSELFQRTEVDVLVVPSGGIPRTENGKPKRKECWARYVTGRSSGRAAS